MADPDAEAPEGEVMRIGETLNETALGCTGLLYADLGVHLRAGKRIYCSNLSFKSSWQDLKDLFRDVGTVVYANVMRDDTGEPRLREHRRRPRCLAAAGVLTLCYPTSVVRAGRYKRPLLMACLPPNSQGGQRAGGLWSLRLRNRYDLHPGSSCFSTCHLLFAYLVRPLRTSHSRALGWATQYWALYYFS